MKGVVRSCVLILFLATFTACGIVDSTTGSSESSSTISSGGVEFITAPWGIARIRKSGKDLIRGLYAIGDCDNADSERNINSIDHVVVGGEYYFRDKPGCPGPRFRLDFFDAGNGKIRMRWEIGPMKAFVNSIQIAMDMEREERGGPVTAFDTGPSRLVRACEKKNFRDVETPCFIPGHGPVGGYRTVDRGSYVEITGPGVMIRRTPVGGTWRRIQCHNHPDAYNCDINLGVKFNKGDRIFYEEEIWVR